MKKILAFLLIFNLAIGVSLGGGVLDFNSVTEVKAESKYSTSKTVKYYFPVHFTDKFNWRGIHRGSGSDFDDTISINVRYNLVKKGDKFFIESQINEDRYFENYSDFSINVQAEPMTFDYSDIKLERRIHFLEDKLPDAEAKLFGKSITDIDGAKTKTDTTELSLNFEHSDILNGLGIYEINGVRYYKFYNNNNPVLFSDVDVNFYKKYYGTIDMSVDLDTGKYLSYFEVVMDNEFKPLFFMTDDYLYELKDGDKFVDTDNNVTVEYGKSLLPYFVDKDVFTYIGSKYVKADLSNLEPFDINAFVDKATPFSEYKPAVNNLADKWASLDDYIKGVSNLNSDKVFKGIKFNFNQISKWNVGGLVPKHSIKSVPDEDGLSLSSEPSFVNKALPDETKPLESDSKVVDKDTDWYGYNYVKPRLQFYQNFGANVSSKNDYDFVGFGRSLAGFIRSGDFSNGVIDDDTLFVRNPKYLTKNTSIDKSFYFSSMSVPRTKEDTVNVIVNDDGTNTTLSFFKNSLKLPILPFSGGAFSLIDGYVDDYILSDISIKNSLNDSAVWSSDGTSVSCIVGGETIKRHRRDGYNRGTIVYIPSGDYIYAISIVNIPFKYVDKAYLMWDAKNADFIYKRFPRAEFSHLLDFTDKADDTNVFIAVPDGDNETFFDNDGGILYNNTNAHKFKIHEFHHGTVYGIREDIYNLWHGVETSKNSNLLRKCDITKYMNVTSVPNKVKASRVFRVDDLLGVGEPIDVDISADKEIERIPAGDDPFSAGDNDDYEVRFSVTGLDEDAHPYLMEKNTSGHYYVYNLYLNSGVKNEPKYVYFTLKDSSVKAFTDGENDRLVFITPDEDYTPKDVSVSLKPPVESAPVISYEPPIPVDPVKVVETLPIPPAVTPDDTVAVTTKPSIVAKKRTEATHKVDVFGYVKYKSGKPYSNLTLKIGDEASKTDENGYFKFSSKPNGVYSLSSELFRAKLNLSETNTVSDMSSLSNVSVTRLISSGKVEFNVICDVKPANDKPAYVKTGDRLPKTGGSSDNYMVYGFIMVLLSALLSVRKKK